MIRKSALYALAVAVLMGTMAVAALAEFGGADVDMGYVLRSSDSSVSAQPKHGVEQPNAGEIREPMETGAVPNQSLGSSDSRSNAVGNEPTLEIGGQDNPPRAGIGGGL